MVEPLADQVVHKINQAAELYHRLILVIAPAGAGKTHALLAVPVTCGLEHLLTCQTHGSQTNLPNQGFSPSFQAFSRKA